MDASLTLAARPLEDETGDALDRHRAAPALDARLLQRQVLGGLVGQQRTQLLGQLAEILRADVGAAHQAELVADQRVANFMHGHGGGSPAGMGEGGIE